METTPTVKFVLNGKVINEMKGEMISRGTVIKQFVDLLDYVMMENYIDISIVAPRQHVVD